jgi:polysaccharide export outer membrane protein
MNAVQQKGGARTSASPAALVWVAMLLTASTASAQTARPILTPAAPPAASAAASSPQATKAAAQAATMASETDTSSYIIGANDSLQITVWQEPSLSGAFPVRPDGMISLVLVGDIQAAGVTPMHLAHDITLKLKKYVQDPIVAVVVTAVNSQRIYLVGEIQRAGPIVMSPGMTPLQAIAEAGGLSPYANGKHIYILRGPQGKQKKIPFNYKLALKGDNRQDVPLLPGDTIVVP